MRDRASRPDLGRDIFFSMTDLHTSARRTGNWDRVGADPLDRLVHLSHLMGQDTHLVQPGGGNTSMKEGDTLLVKASGPDLRTIGREGFTRLSLSRLAALWLPGSSSRARLSAAKRARDLLRRFHGPSE